jgi:hypothetical protein
MPFIALSVSLSLLLTFNAHAEIHKKGQSAEEFARALEINRQYFNRHAEPMAATAGQPVLETDHFRYLLMNGDDLYEDEIVQMHKAFAQNLPADMILVVVTEKSNASQVQKDFQKWISKDRFIVASGNNLGDLTWGRDSYPYPVYKDEQKTVELVAHQYFRSFRAQQIIANSVNAQNVNNQKFVAVGGNLTATAGGDCFIVDSDRTFGAPDSQYLSAFRCKSVTRMPWVAGIGDVDEVIKVLPNNVMLTNQVSYKAKLESLGYKVVMLPEIEDSYRTYANSVILNDTVFMPIYGGAKDEQAKQVYESFGYKVIGIEANVLSDDMNGAVHCLTMTYPNMDLHALLQSLGLQQQ